MRLVTAKSSVITILILLATAFAAVTLYHVSSEESAIVDWTSQSPVVTKIADLPSEPPAINRDCSDTSLQVARGFSTTTESHCIVSTAMGLAEKESKVMQANGYAKAYPLVYTAGGGNPVTVPIPNQAAALSIQGTGFGGRVYMALYRNLHSHVKFKLISSSGPRFEVDTPTQEYFRYGDGQPRQFSYGTLAYSQNGRFFVIDTFNGFARIDLLNLEVKPIATSLPLLFNGLPSNSANAIDNTGRFAAIAYNSPGQTNGAKYFKVIDIATCIGGYANTSQTPPSYACNTIDLRPRVQQVVPNLVDIFNVRFANERTITFVAGSLRSDGSRKVARYSMVAGGQTGNLVNYLALGDSYISGEGAKGYRTGTDTERNRCHQSSEAYPQLIGRQFTSFATVACSGAKLQNVVKLADLQEHQVYAQGVEDTEKAQATVNHTPGVVLQSTFVTDDNPEAITISIGGNDVGFADILAKCVDPLKNLKGSVLVTHHTCYTTYEDRLELVNSINRQLPRLRELYKDLRNGGTGTRRVYVVGYPQIIKPGGNCGLNVQMNADEVKFANDLIAYLDGVIKRAADEAGVVFVDTQAAFDGYRLCEGDSGSGNVAVNGLTIGKTSWGETSVVESFHPNKKGHQMLAQTVASQTDGLTMAMPEPVPQTGHAPVDPNLPLLQNAPVSGRTVRHVQLLEQGEPLVQKGTQLDLVVNAQDYYTKPSSTYEASLHSHPISLGRFTSDANGNLNIPAVIPAAAEPGFHTIHIYGDDIFGNPIDLRRSVYVAGSPDDYDSDGVPNDIDSCSLAAQSGIDMDTDDIDDVCDPLLTPLPTVPDEPEGIIWRDDAVLEIEIAAQGISGQ